MGPVNQVVILVGGEATPLDEQARGTPKPLTPIEGDRRFLDYLLDEVARQGFGDILLVCSHLGEQLAERYAGGRFRGARLRVVQEPEPRGTAGALREAAALLDPVFLVMNGDCFWDINLRAFERAAAALPALHAVASVTVPDGGRYAGLYRLDRRAMDEIGRTAVSMETEVFPGLAARGELAVVPVPGFFIDLGLPEALGQARAELPRITRRPCAFLDRDGTLNLDAGYTYRPEDLAWTPDAVAAIRALNDRGYRTIVCTNQSGIARGYFDEAAMHAFHAAMQQALAREGAFVDAFYFCPYHADGVVPGYCGDHPDRKPNPGMLLRAMADWSIDPARSFMIGDQSADMEAAAAAGVPGYRYEGGSLLQVVERATIGDQRAFPYNSP